MGVVIEPLSLFLEIELWPSAVFIYNYGKIMVY